MYALIFMALLSDGNVYTAAEVDIYNSKQECQQVLDVLGPMLANQKGVVSVHTHCAKVTFEKGKKV